MKPRTLLILAVPALAAHIFAAGVSAQGLSGQGSSKPGSNTPPKSDTDRTPPRTGDSATPHTDFACFSSALGSGHFRVEWPDSRRWAIFAWPAGTSVQVYVGAERARWCWGKQASDVQKCIIDEKYTRDVPRGGC